MQTTTDQPQPTLSHRRGKIARLPRAVRDHLNLRLDDGEEADQILPWLNDLPEVRQIIAERFNNIPVSPQNLSAWRQGGFQEWLMHRQLLDGAEHMREHVHELYDTLGASARDDIPHPLADYLLTHLTVCFTRIIAGWDGRSTEVQMPMLLKVGQFILKLQQAMSRTEMEALERRKTKLEREAKAAARLEYYQELEARRENEERQKAEQQARQEEKRQKKTRAQSPSSTAESSPIKVNQASSPAEAPSQPALIETLDFRQASENSTHLSSDSWRSDSEISQGHAALVGRRGF
jgi:hypothetical protein